MVDVLMEQLAPALIRQIGFALFGAGILVALLLLRCRNRRGQICKMREYRYRCLTSSFPFGRDAPDDDA